MRPLPKLPAWTAAALVALAGCLLTAGGLRFLAGVRQREAAARQGQRIEAARSALEAALRRDEDLLFAGRAFLDGSTAVSAEDWRGFVASLDLPERHPGLKSMAFLVPVPRGGAEAYLAARRRAGQALELHDHFTPWPGDPAPGPPEPDLFVIQYLEPAATNLGGLGLDAGANPVQRRAAEQARDTGRPVLTGRLTFGDLSQRDPAMGYFLPVYRGGADPGSAEARRQSLAGWVSLGLWARPLFRGVFEASGCAGQDALEVVDAGPAIGAQRPAAVLYGEGGPLGATWRAVRTEAGGRIWELRFRPAEAPGLRGQLIRWGILGALLSAAFGGLVGYLLAGRRRAEARTGRRDRALEASRARHQALREAFPIPCLELDPEARILAWNAPAAALLGRDLAGVRGQPVWSLAAEGGGPGMEAGWLERLGAAGQPERFERVDTLAGPGGQPVSVHWRVQAVRGADGPRQVGFLALLEPGSRA